MSKRRAWTASPAEILATFCGFFLLSRFQKEQSSKQVNSPGRWRVSFRRERKTTSDLVETEETRGEDRKGGGGDGEWEEERTEEEGRRNKYSVAGRMGHAGLFARRTFKVTSCAVIGCPPCAHEKLSHCHRPIRKRQRASF